LPTYRVKIRCRIFKDRSEYNDIDILVYATELPIVDTVQIQKAIFDLEPNPKNL